MFNQKKVPNMRLNIFAMRRLAIKQRTIGLQLKLLSHFQIKHKSPYSISSTANKNYPISILIGAYLF